MHLQDILANTSAGLGLGEPWKVSGLGIVPLLCAEVLPEFPYLDLVEDAISKRDVRITETSDRGEVPVLKVENEGGQPVVILEGEELVGGKQNRVVNTTVIVMPGSSFEIPVSCMEAGRWAYRRREFDSGEALFRARSRAIQKESVIACMREEGGFRSDQRAIWNEVSQSLGEMGASSSTSDFRAGRERMSLRIEEFVDGFRATERQVGGVFISSAGVLGMELLGTPDLFKRASGKIVRSFAFEVLSEENIKDIRSDETESWWKKVLNASISMHPSPGPGDIVKLNDPDLIGSGLLWNHALVHFSCFPANASSDIVRRSGIRRASVSERRRNSTR
jgi:hypothetical protein